MRSIIAISLLAVVCLVVAVEAEAQSHPIIGTWEMDPGRSTADPGPGLQSDVRSYAEGEDDFIIFTSSRVTAQGNPGFVQVAFKPDGGRYPIYTQGTLAQFLNTGAESTTIGEWTAPDANTFRNMIENDGQPGLTFTHMVSPDGQTLTSRTTGTNGQGQVVNDMFVFDRVR